MRLWERPSAAVLAERGSTGSSWASPLGCGRHPISPVGASTSPSSTQTPGSTGGSRGPASTSTCFPAAHPPWRCWALHSHCAPVGGGAGRSSPVTGTEEARSCSRICSVSLRPQGHTPSPVGRACSVGYLGIPPHLCYVNQQVSCRAFFFHFSRSILVGKASGGIMLSQTALQRVRGHCVLLGPLQMSGLSLEDDGLCPPSTPPTRALVPPIGTDAGGIVSGGSLCSQRNTALSSLFERV